MSVRNILRGAASGGITIAFFSFLYTVYRNLYNRYSKVPKLGERVLVLGASGGIGRSIALQYAERGAQVCIVGRREALVNEVVAECHSIRNTSLLSENQKNTSIFGVAADFADVDDMIRTRTIVEASEVPGLHSRVHLSQLILFFFENHFLEWKGFDTLVVAAGVSAIQPLMAIAEINTDGDNNTDSPGQPTKEGVQRVADVAAAATRGNYVGPLISAATFVSFFIHLLKHHSYILMGGEE